MKTKNFKNKGIRKALKEFLTDLKSDSDFIDYKAKAIEEGYGVVVSAYKLFTLQMDELTSEKLIINHLKSAQ
jgi:hypothetical protein